MQFDLIEFNRIRLGRGKEAARLRCADEDGTAYLWMSEKDVKANIIEHGPHLGLVQASTKYGVHPSVAVGWHRQTGKPFLAKQDPQRSRDGYWSHPDLVWADEVSDDTFTSWLKYLGFAWQVMLLQNDNSPDAKAVQERVNNGDIDVLAWEPEPPAGEGWWLASVHDTEEGAAALWLRSELGGDAALQRQDEETGGV